MNLYQKGVKKKDERKRKEKQRRERKKIAEQLLQDEVLALRRKVAKLKKAVRRLEGESEESPVDENMMSGKSSKTTNIHQEEDPGEEELEEDKLEGTRKIVERYLEDEKKVKYLTSLSVSEFNEMVTETSSELNMTTWRGKRRENPATATLIPSSTFIFLTLLWLRHYPTIAFLSAIFFLHPRTVTRVLKRTITALARTMKGEIKFPSDDEMVSLRYTFFQPNGLARCVCIVDGTEIQISRPARKDVRGKVYSGKKKQHSLNMMVITKLNGEIVYFSPLRVGAHDQSHWNELELRKRFISKDFGIMGDGGFSFNRTQDQERIEGATPFKRLPHQPLTPEQKKWNRNLSQVRVVVENAIRVIKSYKILSGVFRHWRYGKGQIKGKHILTVCVTLANRKIVKTPLRRRNWMSPYWVALIRENNRQHENSSHQQEKTSNDE